MKVLAINSSPRTANQSKTELMLDHLVKGMKGAGAAVEIVNLRVLGERTTVITSERTVAHIVDIDEALGGRLTQMCGEFAVTIAPAPGRNWRLRQGKGDSKQ